MPMPNASAVLMTELDGVAMKTINHVSGNGEVYLNHDLLLTAGASSHPLAQNLRDMGLDGAAPTMVMASPDYHSILYFGAPM